MYHPADGSWYRKYSDGWLEQGGFLEYKGINGYKHATINLLMPFKDKHYIVLLCSGFHAQQWTACVDNKTTTSFEMHGYENIDEDAN